MTASIWTAKIQVTEVFDLSMLCGLVPLIIVLIVLVVIVKALAVLIPGAAIAVVVWLLTNSPLYTGLAFIVVTLMMIIFRR